MYLWRVGRGTDALNGSKSSSRVKSPFLLQFKTTLLSTESSEKTELKSEKIGYIHSINEFFFELKELSRLKLFNDKKIEINF